MSKFFLIFSYAIRDAAKSKVVLILVIISLGISFAAVLASASILSGFKDILNEGALNDSSHILIGPAGTSTSIAHITDVTKKLEALPNVASWSIRTYALATISKDGRYIEPLAIRGIDPAHEDATTHLSGQVIQGSYVSDLRPRDALLGQELADSLAGQSYDKKRIKVGETFEMQLVGLPDSLTFKVGGIFDGKNFVPNWILYLDKKELDGVAPFLKDSEIAVQLTDPSMLEESKAEIQSAFPELQVFTWVERAGYVTDIESVMGFITLLINRLLIATVFVIICVIIFISVINKRRQIGIMKSMGAGKPFVIAVFMVETFIYSIFAYGLGFAIFYVIYQYSNMYPTSTLIGDFKLFFDPDTILYTSLALLFASLAGCFVPAYLAARTEIISVLHSE